MSRVGKKNIALDSKVEVTIQDGHVDVKGPQGALSLDFDKRIELKKEENTLSCSVKEKYVKNKDIQALWGLVRNLVNNMVLGVADGFEKKLEIQGVGYRASVSGKSLSLVLGFSHDVSYVIPEGIEISVEKNIIIVKGIDKQKVGQVAAEIRAFREPEPYKGKGIRYVDERVRRKIGKKAAQEGAAK